MSSINSIGSTSNNAAVYQEYLARLKAQKLAANTTEITKPTQPTPPPSGDVDHDGDSH